MTEHLLSTLGLALRAGAVAVGEEPVGAAARGKKARVIFTARDAAASSVRRAYSFAHAGSCLCLPFPADKDAFGRALGRTSVAMCAVTDIGFAQSLVRKLAAADGETYGAASQALDIKAKRARERKEEQAQHEKNLRQGASMPPSRRRNRRTRRKAVRSRSAGRPGGLTARTGYIRNAAAAMRKADGRRGRKRPDSGMRTLCR